MFGKQWTSAQGTIVDRVVASAAGDGLVVNYDFLVDVRTESGEVFRAKVPTPRIATDFKDPSIGDTVAVEFDPGSHKVRFDKDDPKLSMKAYHKQRQANFDAALNAPAGTSTAAATAPSGEPLAAQLQALMQAQLASGGAQVIRLDPNNPDAAALRETLLRAMGQVEPPAQPGDPTIVS
jgi:hypothetical protein